MTFDQLLMLHGRASGGLSRWWLVAWLSASATVIGITVACPGRTWLVWPYVAWVALGYSFLCVMWRRWRAMDRCGREISARVNKVPLALRLQALDLYGNDWELAAIECHEAHIPGDCPLCGAE